MGKHETATELAILSAGRNPQWVAQEDYTGAPTLASSGVYLENALKAPVVVALRESAHRRTARVTVAVLDNTAGYTITIDGNAVNYVATGDTEEELIQALAAAITADTPAGAGDVVTATAVDTDDDGLDDTLLLVGKAEAFWTLTVGASGTGELLAVADGDQATMRVWGYPKGSNDDTPEVWTLIFDAVYTLTERGFLERFDVGGISRLYIELDGLDGTGDGAEVTYAATVRIGPCVTE